MALKVPTLTRQVKNLPGSIDTAKELSLEGQLLNKWGSRSLAWRIYLGLLTYSENTDDAHAVHQTWVSQTRAWRKSWAELEKSISLIAIAQKTKNFNPLAPPKVEKDDKASQEREMKDLIKQDVNRTLQEFDYFHKNETKDLMTQLLYLWGRQNPDYGYKQGMNEILAIIMIVFDTERCMPSEGERREWDNLSDDVIAADHFLEYMFDADQVKADVYTCFDRVLQLGIKYLYMDTKDLTELKQARMRRQEDKAKSDLFSMKQSKAEEQKEQAAFRKQLEQAFEREKSKSVIAKRCTRIYEEHLKNLEPRLHQHLCDNEVVPELHLTRWLRCMMSREFQLETTLKMWDFIFVGIEPVMVETIQEENKVEDELNYDTLLKAPKEDPFINLECISIAMISLLKTDLLESDFSMCLGLLMSYKEPEDPSTVLN